MASGNAEQQTWQQLLDQANEGRLTLSRDVGDSLSKVCDDYMDKLGTVLEKVDRIRFVDGFGSFPSGEALASKFAEKGSGTPASIDAVILEHIETVKLIQQVVAKSIENLKATDDGTGQQVTKTGQDIPQG
ncbi:hypothetical protein [Nocardia cyriacigeorgica]|uniref:hypothetical protein n=1 Tax=Nocardia cyriacigeorgica TaxID=135487 RepID=UPI002458E5C7|nr:hypothetical protein [Nocardia cyriacigeorgica]